MGSCRNPTITLVVWEARNPRFVFVAIPNERGRYVRTDACVATVPCDHCGAVVGEPCRRGKNREEMRYGCGTHWLRRRMADRRRASTPIPDDIVCQDDGALVTIKKD
jgi:hypothetical protein